jgi:hypothetical protein
LSEGGEHGLVVVSQHARSLVALAKQQPVPLVAVEMCGDERPRSLEPLAVQTHRQPAVGLLLNELVRAAVPDLNRAGAVVPLWNLAGKGGVIERVILDVHRERALPRLEWHTFGQSPGRQCTVTLESEVVVEAPRIVALDDEDRILPRRALRREGLGRPLRVALAVVLAELRRAHTRFVPFASFES